MLDRIHETKANIQLVRNHRAFSSCVVEKRIQDTCRATTIVWTKEGDQRRALSSKKGRVSRRHRLKSLFPKRSRGTKPFVNSGSQLDDPR